MCQTTLLKQPVHPWKSESSTWICQSRHWLSSHFLTRVWQLLSCSVLCGPGFFEVSLLFLSVCFVHRQESVGGLSRPGRRRSQRQHMSFTPGVSRSFPFVWTWQFYVSFSSRNLNFISVLFFKTTQTGALCSQVFKLFASFFSQKSLGACRSSGLFHLTLREVLVTARPEFLISSFCAGNNTVFFAKHDNVFDRKRGISGLFSSSFLWFLYKPGCPRPHLLLTWNSSIWTRKKRRIWDTGEFISYQYLVQHCLDVTGAVTEDHHLLPRRER